MSALPSPPRFRGRLKDLSGTVTTGGTSQKVSSQNANRDYLLIQNNHASADLWVNFALAAVVGQPSLRVPAGAVLTFEGSFIPTDGVWVISNTAAHPFTIKEG